MADQILISIAAFRDPQLIPTVQDCLKQAADPARLRFAIAWQHSADETLPEEWRKSDQFIILDIPHEETKGVCWARSLCQQQYADEAFFLQLDSHHRFVPNWDQLAIKMWSDLVAVGCPKPLLTAYLPSFNPDQDPGSRINTPWQMNFDRFTPEGCIFFRPGDMRNWQQLRFPAPARWFSAHFAFTAGAFCKEVPYDPNYWFHGEEINMAARAFTHGYDLFHPHQLICWHEYTRRGRTKVWDVKSSTYDWGKLNDACHARNRKLFEMDGEKRDIDFAQYGFGAARSLADYERYAGVRFAKRGVQKWVLDDKPPPNPQQFENQEAYEKSFLPLIKHCIDIMWSGGQLDDYDFWAVTFHDKDGNELYRQDADEKEIQGYKNDPDHYCKVWRSFYAEKARPVKWMVRPHSKTKGWCDLIEGPIK